MPTYRYEIWCQAHIDACKRHSPLTAPEPRYVTFTYASAQRLLKQADRECQGSCPHFVKRVLIGGDGE